MHHIIPWRISRDNSEGNLIPLCRRHHKHVDWIFIEFEKTCDRDIGPDDMAIWRMMLTSLIPTPVLELMNG